ncbi:MAG: GNAT family N-acetyltransferase [Clostridia bacterium]|nr:GNAT family N-acetyltransferase [Clostridia bacterium]
MSIVVRPARREELARVNELRRQVNDLHVEGRPRHFKPGFGPELQAHVYDQLESDRFDVLVALADGEIAGFATVQFVRRPEGPYTLPLDFYHVEEFGVDAAFRRRGVATALVEYMKRDARERGFNRLDLDVWAFNDDALAFYEAVGFQTYRRYMELNL